MKILFLGLGSVGQRHLINAKKIFKGSSFFALRVQNHKKIIKNTKLIKYSSLDKYYKIKSLYKFSEAINLKPDLTFICNPSSKHLTDAIKFANIGSNLFIEKPLGRSKILEKKLIKVVKKKKLITMVGYQSRFNPIIKKLKKIIVKKTFGKIIYGNFNFLTFLPNHHKYENYKRSYAANRTLGGGVIDSLIHEIDIIAFLFGLPTKHFSIKSNLNILKIDCDENFSSLMKFKIRKNDFNIFLRLSFTQNKGERKISILFEKALLKICLIRNTIEIHSNKNKMLKSIKFRLNQNKLFYDQLVNLKRALKLNKQPDTSVIKNRDTQTLFFKLIN